MNTLPFKNIAIGVAFSPNLKANLHEAARLGLLLNAHLHLIHVGNETAHKIRKVNECLASFKEEHLNYNLVFEKGKPAEGILNYLNSKKIDLIILGAIQKENVSSYYVGSIGRKITRAANCSVLLLIKPSIHRRACEHIVVDGIDHDGTIACVTTAFLLGDALNSNRITIVEEIKKSELSIKVDDDKTLRKANLQREKITRKKDARIERLLATIDPTVKESISIEKQAIFGKRGYSIGHYAQISRADLLVINATKKLNFWDHIFTNDIEYILKELPTDLLIVK